MTTMELDRLSHFLHIASLDYDDEADRRQELNLPLGAHYDRLRAAEARHLKQLIERELKATYDKAETEG